MIRRILIATLALLIVASCGTTKKITNEALEEAYLAGDYETVYTYSSAQINKFSKKGAEINSTILGLAGRSAYKLNKVDEAADYLSQSLEKNAQQESLYPMLAEIYAQIDTEKEIELLETYGVTFKNGKYQSKFTDQLFMAHLKGENSLALFNVWPGVSSSIKSKEDNVAAYLNACKQLDKKEETLIAAEELLKINHNNAIALEIKAVDIYKKAEVKYVNAFETYNKKKTTLTYGILRRDLKKISAQYREARDIFESLYKASPEKSYASYLTNIYSRLQDDSKTDYWKKRAE